MQFANPNLLWLLLVIPPALVLFFWWSWRQRKEMMNRFIQSRLLGSLVKGLAPGRDKLRLGCLVLAAALLVISLARPQWGFTWEEVKQRGVDIVVAIDTSKSMLATDIAPNRLARAKLAALELLQLAKSDRLGLVAFAGTAFLSCPLTIDDSAFRQTVESLDVNTLPQGGTALAAAIEVAQTAFKEGDNHRVLVLMTDGEDHDSKALEAAQKAAENGLKIYTIGVGSTEGDLLRIKDGQGQDNYVRDQEGNVVKSRLDERLLQEIAGASDGGFYLPLRGAKTIEALYEQGLSKLPKSENQEKLVKQYQERYHWPLGLAILLLVLEVLLPERARGAGPNRPASPAARAVVGASLVLLMGFGAPGLALASPASALRDYRAGKFEESLKEHQRLLEKKGADPRLHFNAGAAAYRTQKYEEAARQFNQAVASTDLKLQALAYYNRGNAHFRWGEKGADPKQRAELWEKSVKDYELSLKLSPEDADAKFNLGFVKKKLEELKQQQQSSDDQRPQEPSEAAKQAKAQADEAVRRREYVTALNIMEKQLEKDPTTSHYSDFIQRLKEVTGVQTNTQR